MSNFKKIQPLSDDAAPSFATTNKSGYLEEQVDIWVGHFLEDTAKVIAYQNATVEALEEEEERSTTLEAEIAVLKTQLSNAGETVTVVDEAAVSRLREEHAAREQEIVDSYEQRISELHDNVATIRNDYEAQLAEARESIVETVVETLVEQTEAVDEAIDGDDKVAPSVTNEYDSASHLLELAEKIANEHIAEAKAQADVIVGDAKASIDSLNTQIEELEAVRYATYGSLVNFFSSQLETLGSNPVFNTAEESADEATITDVEVDELESTDGDVVDVQLPEEVLVEANAEDIEADADAVEEIPAEDDTVEDVPEVEEVHTEDDSVTTKSKKKA